MGNLDFLQILISFEKGKTVIYPDYQLIDSKDLMVLGGKFYAVYDWHTKLWSQNMSTLCALIDEELDNFYEERKSEIMGPVTIEHIRTVGNGRAKKLKMFIDDLMWDNFHILNSELIFSNSELTRESYATSVLPYALKAGPTDAYDELKNTLYSPEEIMKGEWFLGSIIYGDSRKNDKFLVLHGPGGTGKSTFINIVQKICAGYYAPFDAKKMALANNSFPLQDVKDNPLIGIQHDGDLSRIEDNTILNSLISHEMMSVNTKGKNPYPMIFQTALIMGTNTPVKITDAKSGIIRRLIDMVPTGNTVPKDRYLELMSQIEFEKGAIAAHCLELYKKHKHMYDKYVPLSMISATNDFYNYVLDCFDIFKKNDSTTLGDAWSLYKVYCDDAKVPYPLSRRVFQEELKNYFREYDERGSNKDGNRVRRLYSGFLIDKFQYKQKEESKTKVESWIEFKEQDSLLDGYLADYPAQLANSKGYPSKQWVKCTTKLMDISTKELHWVKVPQNLIVIDFDIKDEKGEKSFEKNFEAASKWPRTYAELSKSGSGIHLHYIFEGDTSLLESIYAPDIEVKVYNGDSSLRRKLVKCNDIPIATINSGLPLKGEKKKKKMIKDEVIQSNDGLISLIERNLRKEIFSNTTQSINFIYDILEECYAREDFEYDVRSMAHDIQTFAFRSTHQKDNCIKKFNSMHFCSKKFEDCDIIPEENIDIQYDNDDWCFFDTEVFPNLFIIVYKFLNNPYLYVLINPKPEDVKKLFKYKLVGFNCRKYDNHILFARSLGYDNYKLYCLSKRIIAGERDSFFAPAYDISATDIFDFITKKQSLKKYEIELNMPHKECELRWDEDVPESKWEYVAEYCKNDVLATEAVWKARQGDFLAREILAELTGLSINSTTNQLTTKFIFGDDKKPQSQFEYRDLGQESDDDYTLIEYDEYTRFRKDGKPVFPGYSYSYGVSTYRGEEVGEGGYVYAQPGMYGPTITLDVASMHPSSVIAENLFGDLYTSRFNDILQIRIAIKHKDYEKAKSLLDGAIAPYLDDISKSKALADALKIAINSVYGLTSASFPNSFKDPRNIDNIVAKRGALFMINLKHEVEKRNYTVVHIKTDSIKIANYDNDIIDFVIKYGKLYGYNFEVEHIFEKICLVNNAVYVAKLADTDPEEPGKWTATGTQFQVPFIFKTLFSKESIEFSDYCETKSVKTYMCLDMNEGYPDNSFELKQLKKELDGYLKVGAGAGIESVSNQMNELENAQHNYIFVGKVGLFTPVVEGVGGGLLVREQNGKFNSVTGTSGYRWLESDTVKKLKLENSIDITYYHVLLGEAIDTLNKFGDVSKFIEGDCVNLPFIN